MAKKEKQETTQETDSKILLTGLWLHKSQDGVAYMTGNLGTGTLLLFKNKNKASDNSPDYFLFLAPKGKKETPGDDDNPFEGLL